LLHVGGACHWKGLCPLLAGVMRANVLLNTEFSRGAAQGLAWMPWVQDLPPGGQGAQAQHLRKATSSVLASTTLASLLTVVAKSLDEEVISHCRLLEASRQCPGKGGAPQPGSSGPALSPSTPWIDEGAGGHGLPSTHMGASKGDSAQRA
jgi:hypothetical protein